MRRYFIPSLLYCLIIALVFGQALVPPSGQLLFGDDIHRYYYFFKEYFRQSVFDGVFPWWNPFLFSGAPFAGNPQATVFYPFSLVFLILPTPLAFSWYVALHLLIAMTGMYFLISNIKYQISNIHIKNQKLKTEYSVGSQLSVLGSMFDIGAWVAGVIFGLSSFFMARVWAGHIDVIAAASWMPWVIGAFYRLVHAEVGRAGPVRRVSHATSSSSRSPSVTGVLGQMYAPVRRMKSIGSGLLGLRALHEISRSCHPQLVIAAIVFAMQLLAGYQTMAFFTAIAVGIVILLYCYIVKSFRPLIRALCAGLLGVGLAGIQLIPEQEFFRSSIRTFSFPYSWNSYGALTVESLNQLVNPFYFGDQLTYRGPPPNFAEHSMYVGIGGLVLAIIGVISLIRWFVHAEVTPAGHPQGLSVFRLSFIVIALFGLWVSLGPNAPIDLQYILWKIVPAYTYLRIPPRHLILVVFGLAALAGMGMDMLAGPARRVSHASSSPGRSESGYSRLLSNVYTKVAMRVSWLRFARSAGTHEISRAGHPQYLVWILFAAVVAVEMVLFGRNFIELRPVPEARHDKELIALLKQDREPYRLLPNFGVWVPPRDSLDFNAAATYRIFSVTGYDPSILRPYYEFIDLANGNAGGASILAHDVQVPYLNIFNKATDFLNIKYILHPRGSDPLYGTKDPRFRLVKEEGARDYRLYENTAVLPRFFLVYDVTTVPEKTDAVTLVKEGKVDFASRVLIPRDQMPTWEKKPDCQSQGGKRHEKEVVVSSYTSNKIVLSTATACDGFLVSSEVLYPGWEAYLDNKKVDILEGNLAFRTIFVSRGKHTVVFRYSPSIFLLGATVTMVSAVVAVFLLWRRQVNFPLVRQPNFHKKNALKRGGRTCVPSPRRCTIASDLVCGNASLFFFLFLKTLNVLFAGGAPERDEGYYDGKERKTVGRDEKESSQRFFRIGLGSPQRGRDDDENTHDGCNKDNREKYNRRPFHFLSSFAW